MLERRNALRIKKKIVALYCPETGAGQRRWDLTIVKDLSDEGIRIFVNRPIAKGEILILRLKIPFQPFDWVDVKGRAVSIEPLQLSKQDEEINTFTYAVSVKFKDPDEKKAALIKKYVEWFFFNKELLE